MPSSTFAYGAFIKSLLMFVCPSFSGNVSVYELTYPIIAASILAGQDTGLVIADTSFIGVAGTEQIF